MKIVIFGCTDVTCEIIEFLYDNSYKIVAVVTAPEVFNISYNKEGVNNARFVDLYEWGDSKGIPVVSYQNVGQTIDELSNIIDEETFCIVAGWYYMVPKKVRDLFRIGCAGFHASLLPKLRGGAPLNWAILLGLKETGVSFFELSDGVDDGLLYAQEKLIIRENTYIEDLVKESKESMLSMLKQVLPKISNGCDIKYKQSGKPTYCGQRCPEDSNINWSNSVDMILKIIKASSHPYHGAYSFLERKKIIIWRACRSDVDLYGALGQVLIVDENIYVICGDGSIHITNYDGTSLLRSSHKRMSQS